MIINNTFIVQNCSITFGTSRIAFSLQLVSRGVVQSILTLETKMGSTKTKKRSSRRKTRRFAPLTDKELQAVGPRPKRYTLRDGRGLFLDVTPAGVRTWIFRYQINGKQEKFIIGRYPEFSLKAARRERDELAVKVSRGVSPAEEKKKERAESTTGSSKNPTVKEFGERYLKE